MSARDFRTAVAAQRMREAFIFRHGHPPASDGELARFGELLARERQQLEALPGLLQPGAAASAEGRTIAAMVEGGNEYRRQ